MALENALIAKIAGGVAVTGGTVGLGVAFKDNIANWFKTNSHSYLIVKATDTSSQPTEQKLKHGKDKNYECKIESVEKAVDCEIVEVTFTNPNKTIDISALNNLSATGETEKTVFTNSATNKFFKLKIDKSNLDSIKINEDTPKTIDLVLKKPAANENNKKYAKLTPEFQVLDGLVSTKSKDLLVAVKVPKGSSGTTDSNFSNYKCTSGEPIKTATTCDVYKFSTNGDVATSLSLNSVNFSEVNTTKISGDSDFVEEKIRLIKVTSANASAKTLNKYWKNENIKFSSTTASSKSWDFKVISRLYGDVNNPSHGFFILEQ